MLKKIDIRNYVIIEEIKVDFSKNLNCITGETGAGKSILMGALGLILGERAESNVLMDKEKKCVVEGYFGAAKNPAVKSFLIDNDLDAEFDNLVLRREIAVNSKSRAFINDTPVNLVQLRELSSLLVDLHQQFNTLELGDNDFQREALDAIAGNNMLIEQYKIIFSSYKVKEKQLDDLRKQQQEATLTLSYNQFLYDELAEAGLKENELENAEAELKLLSHAEEVKQQLAAIYYDLAESEQPLLPTLKSLISRLHSLQQFHSGMEELVLRIQSVQVELTDIAETIEQINGSVQHDPERIQAINDKISLGYKLQKKHGVIHTNDLLKIKNELEEKLSSVLSLEQIILEKQNKADSLLEECKKMAAELSANRHQHASKFAEKINQLLKQVGMPDARIKIELLAAGVNLFGTETITFLFDANKTNRFEPLKKVASGGELSRLMLCIKSLVAKKLQLPTLIFDEIDTGISGEAAKQVGNIMKELSGDHQVIAITHQPQIAAKAAAHYFVYKSRKEGVVKTSVRLLQNDERIKVIAQMLGGEKPTAATVQNAKEMVETS